MVGRACLLASSSFVVVAMALAPATALASSSGPACGHANADNPGHHYGLIKNGCWPQPAPKPVPSPLPVPKVPHPVVTPPGHVSKATPSAIKTAVVVPAAVTPSPVGAILPALRGANELGAAPAIDHNLWVVTALLAAMLLLWLLLVGRAVVGTIQARRSRATLSA